jgi:hypothetical protein
MSDLENRQDLIVVQPGLPSARDTVDLSADLHQNAAATQERSGGMGQSAVSILRRACTMHACWLRLSACCLRS